MLTAESSGRKLKPYVLLPRVRPDAKIVEKFGIRLFLSWAGKTWFDDHLTEDYLQRVFGKSLFGKRLLVGDAFRCHTSEATTVQLRKQGLHTAVIPGGCTKFIQVLFCTFIFSFNVVFRLLTWYGMVLSNQRYRNSTTFG
jgi:hypothetical protein